ncbi:MAG: DUF4360 domain-containing protein [Oligoflexales bacterium]|nr:DUF4360 domain-containing protein [Oligoflexales bacterium]
MKNTVLASLTLLLLLPINLSAQDQSDAPVQFAIQNIRMSGDGCNADNSRILTSPDNQSFSALYDNFSIELPADGSVMQVKTKCIMTIDTTQDPGWGLAIVAVSARGYVYLDEGVSGRQAVNYGFKADKENRESAVLNFKGPVDSDFLNAEEVSPSSLKISGCETGGRGRIKDFVIVTRMSINASKPGRGFMTVDSLDGAVEYTYDLIWKRCSAGARKIVAICKVASEDGRIPRKLVAKGMGPNVNAAERKARNKLVQRCRRNPDRMPECSEANIICRNYSL